LATNAFESEQHNKISQHNIVETGVVLIQVLIDPKSVVESTISWTIDNYIERKYFESLKEGDNL
jgi:hypothetical protein